MAYLDPVRVLADLVNAPAIKLGQLPIAHGIYALRDHEGAIRYVGITTEKKFGFHGRINNRHVTGSEGRSHKFSHAYNTGRMWRMNGDAGADAKLAKALRTQFVRAHCSASVLLVPDAYHHELSNAELAVQAIAPEGMLIWGGKLKFSPFAEPQSLVDALIEEVGYTDDQRAALARQASRCQSFPAKAL